MALKGVVTCSITWVFSKQLLGMLSQYLKNMTEDFSLNGLVLGTYYETGIKAKGRLFLDSRVVVFIDLLLSKWIDWVYFNQEIWNFTNEQN